MIILTPSTWTDMLHINPIMRKQVFSICKNGTADKCRYFRFFLDIRYWLHLHMNIAVAWDVKYQTNKQTKQSFMYG